MSHLLHTLNRLIALVLFLAALGSGAFAAEPSLPGCPDSSADESIEDCPWAPAGKAMVADAAKEREPLASLKQNAPGIFEQLSRDRKDASGLFDLWGMSINYDELAKGMIVHPFILKAIEAAAGIPVDCSGKVPGTPEPFRIVHAGLEHTYGYLFSTLKTPFGYKRARWVKPEIEDGFALPHGSLGPNTREGTLLSNVTWFLGKIAFRGEPKALKALESSKGPIAPELVKFDFARLAITRLEESVLVGPERRVVIRTDFVPFTVKPKAAGANNHLLVYSIVDGETSALISGFPVQDSFVRKALDPSKLGDSEPVVTRYNAFVPGLTGTPAQGSRVVLKSGMFR